MFVGEISNILFGVKNQAFRYIQKSLIMSKVKFAGLKQEDCSPSATDVSGGTGSDNFFIWTTIIQNRASLYDVAKPDTEGKPINLKACLHTQ